MKRRGALGALDIEEIVGKVVICPINNDFRDILGKFVDYGLINKLIRYARSSPADNLMLGIYDGMDADHTAQSEKGRDGKE